MPSPARTPRTSRRTLQVATWLAPWVAIGTSRVPFSLASDLTVGGPLAITCLGYWPGNGSRPAGKEGASSSRHKTPAGRAAHHAVGMESEPRRLRSGAASSVVTVCMSSSTASEREESSLDSVTVGARPLAQPLRIRPGFIRAGFHTTGEGLGEHERGGGRQFDSSGATARASLPPATRSARLSGSTVPARTERVPDARPAGFLTRDLSLHGHGYAFRQGPSAVP